MVLLGPPDHGPFTPVAVWPDANLDMKHLAGAAERALKERRGILIETDPPSENKPFPETHQIAYPLEVEDQLRGVVVLGVNQGEQPETAAGFMQQLGLSVPVVLDQRTGVSQQYLVNSLPTTFFIDRDGVIRNTFIGPMSDAVLAQNLRSIYP